jgi:glycosyltransferase involved in cell wall biosynthesis
VAPGIDVGPAPQGRPSPAGRPYILGLGTTEPRKDFPGLVRAFDLLASRHADLELRLAGPVGWAEHEVLEAVVASPHQGRIHRLGWVDDVVGLVAGAEVFAYPSLYEGFGLPPLEAMALGVPVVATSSGALPEITGDAALLVPARDPEALAGAMAQVIEDSALRERLVQAGRRRVEHFSWARSAEALVALYRDVAASR